MFAPVSQKRVLKAAKRLRRTISDPCPRAELMRQLIMEADPAVAILRPTEVDTARLALINAGKSYCRAKCGGCDITEGLDPPT